MHSSIAPVVVGAGWSGLACAVELVRLGHRPILLEAGPQAGGRARTVVHELGGRSLTLDNGQHLLLGAYRETLRVMEAVGVAPASVLDSRPFAIEYPDGWRLAAQRAPAPWHLALGLACARRMAPGSRWALLRWMLARQRDGWRVEDDGPAAAIFAREPGDLVRRLWRPLCLAALNVELEGASARVFLNVLRDSLGAGARDSRILLARTGLSALFPDAAIAWLRANGAEVRLHCPLLGLQTGADGTAWRLRLRDGSLDAARVVLALPPDRAAALAEAAHPALARDAALLRALRAAPIATVYLQFDAPPRLARPYFALLDDPAQDRHGQWVFDRRALDPGLVGILAVVISGDGPYRELDRSRLGQSVARQVCSELRLPPPRQIFAIVEKHATLVPAPGLARPKARLGAPGIYLAGDSADSEYPSTIEGSVRAGVTAARALTADASPGESGSLRARQAPRSSGSG